MTVYQPQLRLPSHLAAARSGKVVLPEHGRFDEGRQAWNLAIDQTPSAVVLPESAQDVAAAVLFKGPVTLAAMRQISPLSR